MNLDDLFHVFIDVFILCSTCCASRWRFSWSSKNGELPPRVWGSCRCESTNSTAMLCWRPAHGTNKVPFWWGWPMFSWNRTVGRCLMARFFFSKKWCKWQQCSRHRILGPSGFHLWNCYRDPVAISYWSLTGVMGLPCWILARLARARFLRGNEVAASAMRYWAIYPNITLRHSKKNGQVPIMFHEHLGWNGPSTGIFPRMLWLSVPFSLHVEEEVGSNPSKFSTS